jgi:hypothetical protein
MGSRSWGEQSGAFEASIPHLGRGSRIEDVGEIERYRAVIAEVPEHNTGVNSMPTPTDKYGIPSAKRIGKLRPKTGVSSGGTDQKTMASAKKVIEAHQAVIKALAKR